VVLSTNVGFSAEHLLFGSIIAEITSVGKVEHLTKSVQDFLGPFLFFEWDDDRSAGQFRSDAYILTWI